jgi:hypothetical protein
VLDQATVPQEPVRAEWLRELGVGSTIGLLVGLGLAVSLNYLRRWKTFTTGGTPHHDGAENLTRRARRQGSYGSVCAGG